MDTLQELLAREQIKEAKCRYFRGLDTKDFELMCTALTEDVRIHYGPMGLFEGRQAFLDLVTPLNNDDGAGFDTATGLHHALNPEIRFLSDEEAEVHSVTYFVAFDSGKNSYLQQSGTYIDRCRPEQGVWKICESNYTLWFHQGSTVGAWTPLFPDGPVDGSAS